jgi:hypothetical protein
MEQASYQQTRAKLEAYFDRTAADQWAKLTSDAPVSGIRATVRAGRDRMRETLLSWLPQDLSFGCTLYPLSYNPSEKSFFFDADCPLMDEYFAQLKKPGSEAHTHLSQAQVQITELHKKSSGYLKRNFQVDVEFFDLRPIP